MLGHYHYSPTANDHAAVYETKIIQLCTEKFPNHITCCFEFMKVLTKFDQFTPTIMNAHTKIMKFGLAFAADLELRGELVHF